MKPYMSWGRYPRSNPAQVIPLSWMSEVPNLNHFVRPVLVYGKGRSYGDCCLNDGGTLLDSSGLDRFIHFDANAGILRCEAGVTLRSILQLILPANWFLSVTPGTQFVTVGGAIANDVHGKNHHRAGSFACHVLRFELLRSDRGRVLCSRETNADLFQATIGGLGLTGIILWAEFQLKPVSGPWIDCEQIRFGRLEEFFELSELSDESYEYTVAWLDCLSGGKKLGRGIFMRGNHSSVRTKNFLKQRWEPHLPGLEVPEIVISRPTIRAFNWIYFHRQWRGIVRDSVPFEKFFYPLDRLHDWNRLYGRRGFLQYQFIVPYEKRESVREILESIVASRADCALSVLKVFGPMRSPGLLSFSRPGVTLALDFPFQGSSTLDLCERFDDVVRNNGGVVYPAKDARMSPESFKVYFPHWREFSNFLDPHFSSDFWRRVTATDRGNQ
jgi:FAD/FMN-containing dehydrogenase